MSLAFTHCPFTAPPSAPHAILFSGLSGLLSRTVSETHPFSGPDGNGEGGQGIVSCPSADMFMIRVGSGLLSRVLLEEPTASGQVWVLSPGRGDRP